MNVIEIIFAIVTGYLIGSIPFGLLLTKASGLGDIRDIGSGNIGATNVLRTGNKKIAAATLLLDMAKGFIAVTLFEVFGSSSYAPMIAGLAAFVGHCFPVWLKFEGGKGVATFFGVVAAWHFPVALLTGFTWIAVALVFRYSSLAALVAVAASPLFFLFLNGSSFVFVAAILAALVLYRHKANIARLVSGTETKIGDKVGSSANTD